MHFKVSPTKQLTALHLSPNSTRCIREGTVKDYGGLVTIRAFLGLVEGPMFPGIVLCLSEFYTRKELSLR